MNQAVNDRLSKQFEALVPLEGKAESLAGEIVRAMSRIGYRFYNDGDQLGIGYGKETCNPAGRFLAAKTNEAIASMVLALWGVYRRDSYETLLDKLAEMVADYIDDHPELREQPTPDMWSYADKYEDVDDSDDEDDDDDFLFQ
ncbi:MAG: hypothetical protein IKG01_10050 [Lachnospiraceae bacterium]|nr:hypothetical protein [Lachnospiraceae bacterium]